MIDTPLTPSQGTLAPADLVTAHEQQRCCVEQAEQTAYWIYDNLLTMLLRLEHNNKQDLTNLLLKVKSMYADLGPIIEAI